MAEPPSRLELPPNGYLRAITVADVTDAYVDGLNDPDVHRFLEGPRLVVQSRATVEEYVQTQADDARAILFGLFVDGALRGTIRLHDIEEDESAWVGIALFDKSQWGNGWAGRAIHAVTDFASSHLGVKVVYAGILQQNIRSQRAFARAGFGLDRASNRPHPVWRRDLL